MNAYIWVAVGLSLLGQTPGLLVLSSSAWSRERGTLRSVGVRGIPKKSAAAHLGLSFPQSFRYQLGSVPHRRRRHRSLSAAGNSAGSVAERIADELQTRTRRTR